MPRPRTQIPPYPRKPSNGQARVHVWVGDRRIDRYLGKFGSEESKAEYAHLVAQIAAGTLCIDAGDRLTVAQVIDRWFALEGSKRTPRDLSNYTHGLAPMLRLYGPTPAADFDAAALETLREAMVSGSWMNADERHVRTSRGQAIGWSAKVTNRHVTRIGTVWRWADRRKLVPKGSYGHLKSVPAIGPNDKKVRHLPPRKPANPAHVEATLPHLPRDAAAMVRLCRLTGMRPETACIMRPMDVDRSGDVWTYKPQWHKGTWRGQVLRIAIGPEAQKVLAPFLSGEPDGWCFRTQSRRRNIRYTPGTFAQVVRRACDAHKIPRWSPYRLRHLCKREVSQAFGTEAARNVLGQLSIDVTEGYDHHVDFEQAKTVARKVG